MVVVVVFVGVEVEVEVFVEVEVVVGVEVEVVVFVEVEVEVVVEVVVGVEVEVFVGVEVEVVVVVGVVLMHALASSETAEHYTPSWVIRLVYNVMGDIDLDPASCAEAQETVQARAFHTAENSGLQYPWHGRLFINPPGDPRGSLPKQFWIKLANEVRRGRVTEFVWLGFNLSQLRTLQGVDEHNLLADCDVCIPKQRIRFSGDSPTKDNMILYYGPNSGAFYRYFRDVGIIL